MRRRMFIFTIAMITALSVAAPIFAEDQPCQHEWTEWRITETPTCGTTGLETRYCTLCDTEERQMVPATGNHEWDDWIITETPTCVTTGLKTRYCTLCDTEESRIVPATKNHKWNKWKVTRKSTVFKAGKKVHECVECGKTQSKSIAKVKPFAKFKKSSYKLKSGKSKALKAQVKMARGDSIKKWSSSSSSIATVSSTGNIKAKRAGTAKITVQLKSGKTATCKVNVTASKSGGSSSSSGTVYWVPNGAVYHCTRSCSTLSRSRTILSGPLSSCPKPRPCKVCY